MPNDNWEMAANARPIDEFKNLCKCINDNSSLRLLYDQSCAHIAHTNPIKSSNEHYLSFQGNSSEHLLNYYM